MIALLACAALTQGQFSFDWDMVGENGPLKDFSMTANFTSYSEPFEGPVPDNPDVQVPKGGRVFARINVEFSIEQFGEGEVVWSNACGNICQGPPPNHPNHEACDRFCTRPCENTHKFEGLAHEGFWGWALPQFSNPFTESFSEAADMFRKRGMMVNSFMGWLTTIRDDFISKANEKAETEKYVFEPKHAGREPFEPCLSVKFSVFSRRERVVALIMKDLVFQERKGNEFVTVAEVPMGEDVTVPVSEGGMGISGDMKESSIQCLCGDHSSALFQELPAIGLGTQWKSFPISAPTTGFATLIKNMTWGQVQVAATGQNMTNCNFQTSGDAMAQLYLPAGTMLVPDNSNDQIMMLMEDYNSSLAAGPLSVQNRARVACTEMAKSEPSAKTKFAINAPVDGNLKRLADFTAKARIRGPWDQARVWIYTEGATYAEMEKKLIPMIAKPSYLQELDRVLDGGIASAKRKKLVDAISLEMIEDFRCGISGLNRALPVLWKKNGKQLIAAAPGYAASYIKESTSQGPELVANLAFFLGNKNQPEARAAARSILAAVPQNLQARVVKAGGLESVSAGVFAKDTAEVKATVDLLKSYSSELYVKTIAFGEDRLK